MARHVKALLHANELEETSHHQHQTEEDHSQPEPVHSDVSMKSLQRAMSRPGQMRPQDMRVVSQTYGNQAVMRLVEKARLERAANTTASTIQRSPTQETNPIIQRVGEDDDQGGDVEGERERLMKELKKAKRKKSWFKLAKMPATLLKQLLILPVRALDQMTVLDLHVKDAIKYFKTGKRRNDRLDGDNVNNSTKNRQGSAKRAFGRSGLTGYLHGYKSHQMMYMDNNKDDYIKGLSSKFNPLNALDSVGNESIKKKDRKVKQIENELKLLDNRNANQIQTRIQWD